MVEERREAHASEWAGLQSFALKRHRTLTGPARHPAPLAVGPRCRPSLSTGRGRDTGCPVSPARIPASAANALGSCLGLDRGSAWSARDAESWVRATSAERAAACASNGSPASGVNRAHHLWIPRSRLPVARWNACSPAAHPLAAARHRFMGSGRTSTHVGDGIA